MLLDCRQAPRKGLAGLAVQLSCIPIETVRLVEELHRLDG